MPTNAANMTTDQIRKTLRYQVCAVCGAFLSVHRGDIVCSQHREHEGIAKPYEYRDLNIIARREQMTTEIGEQKTRALEKYAGVVSLTKAEAKEIIETIWPGAGKASPAEVYKAINICASYGLNPLMKHLYLIPFSGKFVTVLGIGANRLIASRKHQYSYVDDTPRLMSEDEQKKVYGEVKQGFLTAITVLKDAKTGATARGYGLWPKDKAAQGEDKGNSKANMAMIRSERQALDRLYPADLPAADIPVMDEQYQAPAIDVSVETVKTASEAAPVVDSLASEEQSQPTATVTQETPAKPDLDALTFKNQGEFYQACLTHFKIQKSEADKEISEYDLGNASQRKRAWQQIVGARK